MNPCIKDLTGKRFGKLVVMSIAGRNNYRGVTFNCRCDCGKEVIIAGFRLTAGRTSCGCYRKNEARADRKSKRCAKCREIKPIEDFAIRRPSKDGHDCYCLPCKREQSRLEEGRRERDQAAYKSKKYKEDDSFRLACLLRARITRVMNGGKRCLPIKDLIGCSLEELEKHLESKFQPGMTWENRGRKGWHIDHIRPCSSFDLTDPEQQKQCFHYTNLQPLWAIDNLRKNAKWTNNI